MIIHLNYIEIQIYEDQRNFLLINLAITDLGLLLSNNTPHIIASFNKQWPFGQRGKLIYSDIKMSVGKNLENVTVKHTCSVSDYFPVMNCQIIVSSYSV